MKRNVLTITLALVVSLWSVERAWSVLRCVNPLSLLCFSTIQAAVNASSSGDVIIVSPHPDIRGYRENVVIDTPNITIRDSGLPVLDPSKLDCRKVIVDGCQTAVNPTDCAYDVMGGADGFVINADGVSIKNLTIRHFFDAVEINANSATIENVCFIQNFTGVNSDTGSNRNNIRVIRNLFRGNDFFPVNIRGDDATVSQNLMERNDNILISGDGADILNNIIRTTNDGGCIVIFGNNSLITGNTLEACANECIRFIGDQDNNTMSFNKLTNCGRDGIDLGISGSENNKILSNTIKGTQQDGITINGNNNRIESNVIDAVRDEGIESDGDSNRIALNTIRHVLDFDSGIDYSGLNPDIFRNTVFSVNGNPGIDVFCHDGSDDASTCTGGKIEGNTVQFVFDDDEGMEIDGFNLRVTDNVIKDTSQDGIRFNGDFATIYHNMVERVGTEGNFEPGINIFGNNNMITENTARFNLFAGIRNAVGDNNTYRGNISEQNGKSGIRIADGMDNIVDRNRTLNNHGEGINNDDTATSTDVTNNTSLGNRTDICNGDANTSTPGGIGVFSGNIFITGGTSTFCVVEQF